MNSNSSKMMWTISKKEIDDINGKIDSAKDGEIRSIVFVPEYSDGKARAYYNTEEDGSFTLGKMTLRFAIAPADMAAKIVGSWKMSLNLEATYTRTKAVEAGDDVSIPILEASASDGKLNVTASVETLDEAFFKKELSASVRLVVSLDGVGKSSEYVPMVPSVNMGQGEKLEIPDIYFKAYLVDNFDVNGDGEISADEALAVKQIDIASSSLPIRSLAGIEYFSNIESLDCSGNNLAALDLKSNAALRTLNCSNNRIAELDLSDKLYLMDVDCSGNRINRLVLSNARGLRNLNCANNAIVDIDLKDSHFVSKIECYGNPVKKLNIDDCEELGSLMLQGETVNAIKGNELSFDKYNQASSFEFSSRNLPFTSFNFTSSPSLTSLVFDGEFTDVNISGNTGITSVDLSLLTGLVNLDASLCGLQGLDVTKNLNLKSLDCSGNKKITLIDLSNNQAIEELNAAGLSISELDLTGITQLKTLDVSNDANLTRVICPSQSEFFTFLY